MPMNRARRRPGNAESRVAALCLGLGLAAVAVAGPDYAREARLAEQIVDAILDGDPRWLQADGREFLGIYAAGDEAGIGVLILHGRGFHPDWADTVAPLRVGLAERGYSTLALQMPVLEKDAKYYDYLPIFSYAHARIESGIEYLRDRGHSRIVLVAHSCGVHMAMDWIEAAGDGSIDAFAGLGMGATDFRQPMRRPFPLASMRLPVLDLYGSNEYPAVIRMAPERWRAIAAAGNSRSRQQVLAGADHYFHNHDEQLVAAVADWLDSL